MASNCIKNIGSEEKKVDKTNEYFKWVKKTIGRQSQLTFQKTYDHIDDQVILLPVGNLKYKEMVEKSTLGLILFAFAWISFTILRK